VSEPLAYQRTGFRPAGRAPVTSSAGHALFAQTMGYVALTAGLFALGTYLGRDLAPGVGIFGLLLAFGVLIGLRFAVRRSTQLALALLGAFGLLLGLAVAPTAAARPGHHRGAAAGRVDLPRRAQRVPVLPGDLLRPAGNLRPR
jgi:hypothetical protein